MNINLKVLLRSSIIFILFFLTSSIYSQPEHPSDNSDHFSLTMGLDIGFTVRLGNTYFTRSVTGFIGFYINREKTLSLNIKAGGLKINPELEKEQGQSPGSIISFGLSYRIVKFQKSKILGTFEACFLFTKKDMRVTPAASLVYLYNISNEIHFSGSIGFPVIAASTFDGYHHNPFISFGIMLIAP